MSASAWSLGSSVGWGASDYVGGRFSDTLGEFRVLLWSQSVSLVLLAGGVLVVSPAEPPLALVGFAIGAGVAEAVGISALYRGLAGGLAGIVAPASAVSPVVPFAVDVVAGHVPALLALGGLLLVMTGVLTTAAAPGFQESTRRRSSSVVYGLISAAGFGAYFVMMAHASRDGVLWSLGIARASMLILVVVVGAAARASIVVRGRAIVGPMAVGVLATAGDALYAASTTSGALSVVAVLSATHPVITIVLARLCGHERLGVVRSCGVAMTVAGAAVVSIN